MWTYRLYLWFGNKRRVWLEGTRDQVMTVMCSARQAQAAAWRGATGWEMAQEFHSEVA